MSAYRVIDKLESVIREGVWMPFGWRAVNADRALDLVEKLRSTIPDEAARAKRSDLTERGFAGAAAVEGSAADASARPADGEVIARAQARADDILEQAQNAARDIRRGADDYADQVLASLDASLGKALAAVQKGRQTLASSNGRQREVSAT